MKSISLPWAPQSPIFPLNGALRGLCLSRAFYQRQLLWLALLAGLFCWGLRDGQLDHALAQPWFDPVSRHFPLQHHLWLERLNHVWLKNLSLLGGVAVLGLALAGQRLGLSRAQRQRWLTVFVATLLASLMVSLLKSQSPYHCPWDLLEFGGHAPYVPLFGHLPDGVSAGRCFPAGHASGGFVWMALYFVWHDSHPRRAQAAWWGGLLLGLLMGLGQQMRGAHFLSHTLWSGWVVWATLLWVHWSAQRWQSR